MKTHIRLPTVAIKLKTRHSLKRQETAVKGWVVRAASRRAAEGLWDPDKTEDMQRKQENCPWEKLINAPTLITCSRWVLSLSKQESPQRKQKRIPCSQGFSPNFPKGLRSLATKGPDWKNSYPSLPFEEKGSQGWRVVCTKMKAECRLIWKAMEKKRDFKNGNSISSGMPTSFRKKLLQNSWTMHVFDGKKKLLNFHFWKPEYG